MAVESTLWLQARIGENIDRYPIPPDPPYDGANPPIVGRVPWSVPGSIINKLDNAALAFSVSVGIDTPATESNWLRARDFDFISHLPADATIIGVEMRMVRTKEADITLSFRDIIDEHVALIRDDPGIPGTPLQIGDNLAFNRQEIYFESLIAAEPAWPWEQNIFINYGGYNNLWGTTLTRDIVIHENFGCDISVAAIWHGGYPTAMIYSVEMRLWYSTTVAGMYHMIM